MAGQQVQRADWAAQAQLPPYQQQTLCLQQKRPLLSWASSGLGFLQLQLSPSTQSTASQTRNLMMTLPSDLSGQGQEPLGWHQHPQLIRIQSRLQMTCLRAWQDIGR